MRTYWLHSIWVLGFFLSLFSLQGKWQISASCCDVWLIERSEDKVGCSMEPCLVYLILQFFGNGSSENKVVCYWLFQLEGTSCAGLASVCTLKAWRKEGGGIWKGKRSDRDGQLSAFSKDLPSHLTACNIPGLMLNYHLPVHHLHGKTRTLESW